MSESTTKSEAKERIASHLYFASLYFISVGVLYLWGYWAPFWINILEYLALSDIVKVTAYPIATALLMTAVGAAIGMSFGRRSDLPAGSGREAFVGILLRKYFPLLVFLYFCGTVGLLVYGPIEKWRFLPLLFAVPIYIYVKQTDFLKDVITRESPRSIVIYVLVVLLPLAYGHGRLAADKILSGQAYTYVFSGLSGYPPSSNSQTQPRLVGHGGEHIFFFDPAKTAVVFGKLESDKFLVLKQYEKQKEATASTESKTSLNGEVASKL